MQTVPQWNPENPFPFYRYMRENHPVSWNSEQKCWEVFRYDDVFWVLNSSHVFSSQITPPSTTLPIQRSLLFTDPPRHRMLRSLVQQAFTPKALHLREQRIITLVHNLLDPVLSAGSMEVVHDLAVPLPTLVIAEMLGIPSVDREDFRRWTEATTHLEAWTQPSSPWHRELEAMHTYFQHLIEVRRHAPRSDLISLLLQAEHEGTSLSDEDIQGFCSLLLSAGSETTTHLLSNAFLCFAEHPDVFEALQADASLLEGAIEEIQRYRAPVRYQLRVAVKDMEWNGSHIKTGDLILPIIASANSDERQFSPTRSLRDPVHSQCSSLVWASRHPFLFGGSVGTAGSPHRTHGCSFRNDRYPTDPRDPPPSRRTRSRWRAFSSSFLLPTRERRSERAPEPDKSRESKPENVCCLNETLPYEKSCCSLNDQ